METTGQALLKNMLRETLQSRYPESELQQWFDPLGVNEQANGDVEVRFPHHLFGAWFSGEKRSLLERAVAALRGGTVPVVYRTPKSEYTPPRMLQPFAPGHEQKIATPANTCYTFDTFFHNKKNQLPLALAKELVAKPNTPEFCPFIICGEGTCGKTHLLHAIANSLMIKNSKKRIYIASIEEWVTWFTSISDTKTARQHLLRHDALFFDDAQLLRLYNDMQDEFIFLIDCFKNRKKPIVIVFDNRISNISIGEKIKSRLESGLIINIKKPDIDVRLKYVVYMSNQLNISLSKEYCLLIAQRCKDCRIISGIMTKISLLCKKNKRRLTSVDLEKIFNNSLERLQKTLTPETVIKTVAEHFSLLPADILGTQRTRAVVLARQISMLLCRNLLGVSFPVIGAVFGGKSHTTVVHACKKIQQIQDNNGVMHEIVSKIQKNCLGTQ